MSDQTPRKRLPTWAQGFLLAVGGAAAGFGGCLGAVAGFDDNDQVFGVLGSIVFVLGVIAVLVGIVMCLSGVIKALASRWREKK